MTQAEINSVVAAAIAQWAHAGASAAQITALSAITFSVSDLVGNAVAEQTRSHIVIDTDAAGHGWFVDATPFDNSEFTHAANAAGTDLLTIRPTQRRVISTCSPPWRMRWATNSDCPI